MAKRGRKPGRPGKVDVTETPKRRRGRPPGSKTKKAVTETVELPVSVESSEAPETSMPNSHDLKLIEVLKAFQQSARGLEDGAKLFVDLINALRFASNLTPSQHIAFEEVQRALIADLEVASVHYTRFSADLRALLAVRAEGELPRSGSAGIEEEDELSEAEAAAEAEEELNYQIAEAGATLVAEIEVKV